MDCAILRGSLIERCARCISRCAPSRGAPAWFDRGLNNSGSAIVILGPVTPADSARWAVTPQIARANALFRVATKPRELAGFGRLRSQFLTCDIVATLPPCVASIGSSVVHCAYRRNCKFRTASPTKRRTREPPVLAPESPFSSSRNRATGRRMTFNRK